MSAPFTAPLQTRPARPARLLAALCGACLLFLSGQGHAAPNVLDMRTDDNRSVSWVLTADVVRADDVSQVVEAEGRVVLRRGNEYLKADFVRYFSATNWIYLKNNVNISFEGTDIVAEEAEFDLRSKTGWLKRGQIFVGNPHIYFSGEHIEKYWGEIYTFRDATVSSCIGDTPAWSFKADQAVVEIDGYAQLTWPRARALNQSFLALPFFIIPVKENRQSGFLRPEFGKSTRDGYYYSQPFFWAIDDSQDITLSETFMSERGFMHGIEYRANPRTDQAAWFRFEYLYDDKRVMSDRDDPINNLDGLVRTSQQRYWLRGMYDGYFEDPRWRIKADLDYTSDQNYLREFKRGLGGFEETRDTLFALFGRDLNERDGLRTTQVQVQRDWDRLSLAALGQYNQDPRLGHGNDSTNTIAQRLPEVDLYLHKGRIFPNLPLEVEASAQAVYFYRETGAKGMRYDIYPKLSVPLVSRYGSILISGGLRQTYYATENTQRIRGDSGNNSGESRTIPELDIQASTEFAAVFPLNSAPLQPSLENLGQTRWNAVQHVVQPRLSYRVTENIDQSNNPFYDSDDRIGPRNDLTYSLVNILTRRREAVQAVVAEDGAQAAELMNDYLDFLRFSLSQSYDIREAQRNHDLQQYERRPFGDIVADLTFQPLSYLNLSAKSSWSPYESDFTRHDLAVAYVDDYWGEVRLGYNYRSKIQEFNRRRARDVEALYIGGLLNVWGNWHIGGIYRADLHFNQDVERIIRVEYRHDCFTLFGEYIKDYDDERYSLNIELLGFN